MEQDQKRARRAEYMRNFRRQQRERESAEETYKRRAAEAPWVRAFRQIRQQPKN